VNTQKCDGESEFELRLETTTVPNVE